MSLAEEEVANKLQPQMCSWRGVECQELWGSHQSLGLAITTPACVTLLPRESVVILIYMQKGSALWTGHFQGGWLMAEGQPRPGYRGPPLRMNPGSGLLTLRPEKGAGLPGLGCLE